MIDQYREQRNESSAGHVRPCSSSPSAASSSSNRTRSASPICSAAPGSLDRSLEGVVADEARTQVGLGELDQRLPGATADVGVAGAGFEFLVRPVDGGNPLLHEVVLVPGEREAAHLLERARGYRALRRSGNHDQAIKILNEAVEPAHCLDDPRLLARATLALGGLGVTILDVDRALVARLQDALAALASCRTRGRCSAR